MLEEWNFGFRGFNCFPNIPIFQYSIVLNSFSIIPESCLQGAFPLADVLVDLP